MLGPNEIAERSISAGKTKANLSIKKTFIYSILAGMFIALAGVGATIGSYYGGKLVGALIFPVGLIMVVIAGSQLFTGNNLMIMTWLKGEITLSKLLKNWLFVYLGNLVGAVLIALLVVYSGVFDSISDSVIATAVTKSNLSFLEAIFRGILCNSLVCIAIWMSFGTESASGKILTIIGPIFLFVLCGFEHSVANMFYGPAGVFTALKNNISVEGLSLLGFFIHNLIPVTIGNIIGGAGIVSLSYYLIYYFNKK